eukprot:1187261-Prorocentrum_minimum.AAC.1
MLPASDWSIVGNIPALPASDWSVCRRRQAIVFGHPEADKWTVDAPITTDPDCPKGFKMKIAEEAADGKQSKTQARASRYY